MRNEMKQYPATERKFIKLALLLKENQDLFEFEDCIKVPLPGDLDVAVWVNYADPSYVFKSDMLLTAQKYLIYESPAYLSSVIKSLTLGEVDLVLPKWNKRGKLFK